MSKPINTPFTVNSPGPIDTRLQVSTYAGLTNIPVKYEGLKVYVKDEDKEYRYYSTGWKEWTSNSNPSGSGVWGSITGDINNQTDLISELLLKYNKTGGTISGDVNVLGTIEAYDFLIYGSGPTAGFPYLLSTILGEPAGSSIVENIVFISTADYNTAVTANTLVAGTYYIKT